MSLPGVQVNLLPSAIRSSPASDTSTAFLAGIAETGPIDSATLIRSFSDFEDIYGSRISGYTYLYDAVDDFFREGGSSVYIARVIGPAPVSAVCNLYDAAGSTAPGDVALTSTAITPGTWGNSMYTEVVAGDTGGEFKIKVYLGGSTSEFLVETSSSLVDRAAAVTWSAGSDYIRLALGASAEDPRVQGPTVMATGDDDHDGITDATWLTATNLFLRSYGPGQIACPGRTTPEGAAALGAHCTVNNRVAIVSLDDQALAADLIADAVDVRAECAVDDLYLIFVCGSWQVVPGVSSSTTRSIPSEGSICGMIARSDAAGISPNQMAAGDNGISQYATGLTQAEFDADDRESLNDASVNIFREVNGTVRLYGIRTLVDSSTDGAWTNFANSRLKMAIQNKAETIGESYVFRQIDGAGILIAQFAGELTGMLSTYYSAGSLYGATPEEAFLVDVGSAVNTDVTLAAGELRAKLYLRMSPGAEMVTIDIIRVSTLDSI